MGRSREKRGKEEGKGTKETRKEGERKEGRNLQEVEEEQKEKEKGGTEKVEEEKVPGREDRGGEKEMKGGRQGYEQGGNQGEEEKKHILIMAFS